MNRLCMLYGNQTLDNALSVPTPYQSDYNDHQGPSGVWSTFTVLSLHIITIFHHQFPLKVITLIVLYYFIIFLLLYNQYESNSFTMWSCILKTDLGLIQQTWTPAQPATDSKQQQQVSFIFKYILYQGHSNRICLINNFSYQSRMYVVKMNYLRGACGVTRWEGESNESVHVRCVKGTHAIGIKCSEVN